MATRRRWLLAGMAGALLALLLAAAETAGWPFLRQPMQRLIGGGIGAPVSLQGAFRMRLLWTPGMQVEHLRIAAPAGFDADHLLEADGFEMHWNWLALWRWHAGAELRLRELRASRLDAQLLRLPDGRVSWQTESGTAAPGWPRIAVLAVDDGAIRIDDALTATRLQVRIQGNEGRSDEGLPSGGYHAGIDGSYRGLPLRLQLTTGGLLPLLGDELGGEAASLPLRIDGKIGQASVHFDGAAAALLQAPRLEGAIRLRARSLAPVGEVLGLTLPQTPAFSLDGQLRQAQGVWHLGETHAAVGRSRVGGDLRYDTRTSPPLLSGRLTGSRLLLSDLGPALGATRGEADEGARVLPQRQFDLPSLAEMDADVLVQIDELDFGTAALKPMTGLHTRLRLADAILRLEDLRARVAGGQLEGSTQLDGRSPPAKWAADLRFSGLQLARWISALRRPLASAEAAASRPARPAPVLLSGELVGRLRVHGEGRSTAQILGSLEGQAQFELRNGSLSHLVTELAGLDLVQALGVAVRGDDALRLNCAKLDVLLRDGVAEPRVAVLDNSDSTLRLSGQVDLRDEKLNLRGIVQPKDITPLALRSPLLVHGTLAHPLVEVDPKPLAVRALAAVALGIVATPAAALLPLVDLGSTPGGDPCAAAAPASPAAAASAMRSTSGAAR